MSTKVPVTLVTICFYSYLCKYIGKLKKMNRWFQINLSSGLGCNVIGWVIDEIFVVKKHTFCPDVHLSILWFLQGNLARCPPPILMKLKYVKED